MRECLGVFPSVCECLRVFFPQLKTSGAFWLEPQLKTPGAFWLGDRVGLRESAWVCVSPRGFALGYAV